MGIDIQSYPLSFFTVNGYCINLDFGLSYDRHYTLLQVSYLVWDSCRLFGIDDEVLRPKKNGVLEHL